jgi:heme/copper-type cytochrome/quinol oxidase subunit 4
MIMMVGNIYWLYVLERGTLFWERLVGYFAMVTFTAVTFYAVLFEV